MAWENLEADIADELDGGTSDRLQTALEKWAARTIAAKRARSRIDNKSPAGRARARRYASSERGRESARRKNRRFWAKHRTDPQFMARERERRRRHRQARPDLRRARERRHAAGVAADPERLEKRRKRKREWQRRWPGRNAKRKNLTRPKKRATLSP